MNKKLLCALTLAFSSTFTQAADTTWRTLSPENTLYMDTEHGRIIFELATQFSPEHVKHIKQLVRSGFYDGLTYYRVIDGFVVQGGDMEGERKNPLTEKTMKAEFERVLDKKAKFHLVQKPDLLAEQTGFIDGFAVGRSDKENKEWLLTCPGVVNLARATDPNSGTTDFAIMIGQAPRHLDRNMSIWGRIVHGMEHLNLIKRGEAKKGGVIQDMRERSKIVKMSIAADLPPTQQLLVRVEDTNSPGFKEKVEDRRIRSNDFYLHKGNGALDICYIKPDVEVIKKQEK